MFSFDTIRRMEDERQRHASLERLLDAARECGHTGPAEVARALGETDQVVTNWGARGVSSQGAIKAQSMLGIAADWIKKGVGPKFVKGPDGAGDRAAPASAPHAAGEEVVIVQYDVSGGMDTRGKLVVDGENAGAIKSWKVDREWLRIHVPVYTSLQNLCIVTGFGPSMKPMFNPGDPLLMDGGVKLVDHEGVYFFRVGDQGFIKIIQRVPNFDKPGFVLRIISKNKDDFPPYDISPANPDFQVIGKILTVWKSEQY